MENTNTNEEGKKKGFRSWSRKRKVIIIVAASLLVFSFAARGLGMRGMGGYGSRNFHSAGWNQKGSVVSVLQGRSDVFNSGNIAEFQSMGIIFSEASASRRDGYALVYDDLVRQAASMGADGIINVSISSSGGVFTRNWSGSALVIKYGNL